MTVDETPPSTNAVSETTNGSAPKTTTAANGEFWIFGYASLIWKPPPHFDRRVPGWVTGYVREVGAFTIIFFCCHDAMMHLGVLTPLSSEDHRGTPEAPGRVATLIERSFWATLTDSHDSAFDEKVWGVAYRIDAAHAAEVRAYLDIREINGYTIHYTPFYPAADGARPFQTMAYIGTPENPQFTGPQDVQKLAAHIFASTGPSGPNRDYLWGLEQALNELSPASGDVHVTDLSDRVRAMAAEAAEADGATVKEAKTET